MKRTKAAIDQNITVQYSPGTTVNYMKHYIQHLIDKNQLEKTFIHMTTNELSTDRLPSFIALNIID